jgi:phospholipid transport system substrate-binding protein
MIGGGIMIRQQRPVMRGLIALCATGTLVAGGLTLAAADNAQESVKKSINEVIRVLDDPELKKPARAEERRKKLEHVIGSRFSYDEMSKRALGKQWAKLNDAQRKEFVELFQRLLSNTYAGKIESYSGEPVQYLGERMQDGYAEVRTKVTSGKAEIPLDYRLLQLGGDWRVYDVVVDGVSLVANYRGQFDKIIRTSSYDSLVDKLRSKSDQIQSP